MDRADLAAAAETGHLAALAHGVGRRRGAGCRLHRAGSAHGGLHRRLRCPRGRPLVAGRRRAGRVQPGLHVRPTRASACRRPGQAPPRTAPPSSTPRRCWTMLAVLGEPGPYLLVAWSYGGLVARTAATQHPEQVAGMVLVDATSPLRPDLDEPWNGENGIVDTDTIAEHRRRGPEMGDRPVIVLEAGKPWEDTPPDFVETWSGPAAPGGHDLGQLGARRRRRIRPRDPDPQPGRRGRSHVGGLGVDPRRQRQPASLPRRPSPTPESPARTLTNDRRTSTAIRPNHSMDTGPTAPASVTTEGVDP